MSKKYQLDIFSVLNSLNKKDINVYDTLSEEEQKQFAPYVITRWMSGTSNPTQILLLNELVNFNLFGPLGKKPDILAKLLACCGTGGNKRFQWVPDKKSKGKSGGLVLEVVKEYFDYTTREATEVLTNFSSDDIIDMAEQLGYQKEDLTKLKKELK